LNKELFHFTASENKINYHLMNLRKNSTCDFIGLNYWTSYISNNYTWSSLGQSTFIRCSCICTVWRSDRYNYY
jgi:beta-glucosidase/6-phospho-beta-glucosidase/beta-galactosidase